MPRIPTYTAGKLASEQVGVPSADQSGVIVGQAVTGLANKAATLIEESLSKQRTLLQNAELTKKVSQLDSDMAVSAAEIRQQYLSNPDEGVKQLRIKRQELLDQYKSDITDPDVKLRFDAAGTESLVKGGALDQIWAFQENNKIIQKTHFDRLSSDAAFAGQTDNLDEVLEKAFLLDQDRENFYQAWGGVLEGSKVIDAGQESIIKSYFYNQLTKGNAFKVLKEIDSGRFGPKEGSNGLIAPEKLKELRSTAVQMATAGKEDSAALALVQNVQTNFKIDEALQEPLSATEEKINSLSFLIGQRQELADKGEVSPDEINVLKQQLSLLENIRGAQLSRSNMYITPDPDVEADMTARFFGLFPKGNTKKAFKATMQDVFQFQQDLVKNREKMDPKTFEKLSKLSEAAFQSEIQGFIKGSKFQTKASWFGMGPLESVDKNRLSPSKKIQNVLSGLISNHDPKEGNKQLYETMRYFLDDLSERIDLTNPTDLSALPQADLDLLATTAKRKAKLSQMGLPIYLQNKDTIYRAGSAYNIVGFDPDGMPLVEPKP
jgi:hypothetical protein